VQEHALPQTLRHHRPIGRHHRITLESAALLSNSRLAISFGAPVD
jgi:hypothetical protein